MKSTDRNMTAINKAPWLEYYRPLGWRYLHSNKFHSAKTGPWGMRLVMQEVFVGSHWIQSLWLLRSRETSDTAMIVQVSKMGWSLRDAGIRVSFIYIPPLNRSLCPWEMLLLLELGLANKKPGNFASDPKQKTTLRVWASDYIADCAFPRGERATTATT